MGQRKVIIRTIDVGGDKHLDYLPLPVEENPALGLRGIRLGQTRPELLDQQLRALLRVEPLERCRILLPMVSEVDERAPPRLATQLGIERLPELGVMIEVPSAALLADQLAEHADFLSIGTNDLSQYALAMDRCHAGLADRIDALHPALLRLIAQTCAGAARHGRWVGVCGALASDPLATPVLVGLGVEELSVGPNLVGEIKTRVRQARRRRMPPPRPGAAGPGQRPGGARRLPATLAAGLTRTIGDHRHAPFLIESLQRLGRALMLPIAILPIAGLLLRLGDVDLLDIPLVHDAGKAIFANLALIFAIGIAVGFARDNNGTAGRPPSALVMISVLKVIDPGIDMGVLSGIISGLVAGALYNRFRT